MEFFYISVLIGGLAYWWDTTRTNELALRYCADLCRRSDVQLLDSTIVRQRMWLRKTESWIQICRLYTFDFTGDSESRRQGYIVLLGRNVAEQHMEPWPVG